MSIGKFFKFIGQERIRVSLRKTKQTRTEKCQRHRKVEERFTGEGKVAKKQEKCRFL